MLERPPALHATALCSDRVAELFFTVSRLEKSSSPSPARGSGSPTNKTSVEGILKRAEDGNSRTGMEKKKAEEAARAKEEAMLTRIGAGGQSPEAKEAERKAAAEKAEDERRKAFSAKEKEEAMLARLG